MGITIITMRNQQQGRRRGRGGPRPPQQGGIVRPDLGRPNNNRGTGNAAQMLEKYKTLARDATQAGDRITAEYYYQYADHYFRVLNENRPRFDERQQRPQQSWQDQGGDGDGEPRDDDDGYATNDGGERGYQSQRGERYRDQEQSRGEPRYTDRASARDGHSAQADRDPRAGRDPAAPREARADRPYREQQSDRDQRSDRATPRADESAARVERENADSARDERPSRRDRWSSEDRSASAADPFSRSDERLDARAPSTSVSDEPPAEQPRPRRGRPRREEAAPAPSSDPFAVRRSPERPPEAASVPVVSAEATPTGDVAAPKRRRRSPRAEPGSDAEISLENA